ncbi:MAG: adenine phosphoribosyltransferase [Nitriliruptorales bacterium]|nr:adenine phosphoribosyltransferase [Nitriliruptorales bacterium]
MEIDTAVLRGSIRDIPDFPKQGVTFKDITPLLADPVAFSSAVDAIVVSFGRGTVDKVVGIEARGFIIAAPVAYHFGAGFVPLRKPGKLPYETVREEYELEYGTESLELHVDAFSKGDRVLIVDDVLATGGTARAACNLVEEAGGTVAGLAFVIELEFLEGSKRLQGYDYISLLKY